MPEEEKSGDDPIHSEYERKMNTVAQALNDLFKPLGFALLVFDMDTPKGGRMNYISNATRGSMMRAMLETVDHFESQGFEMQPLPEDQPEEEGKETK